MEPELLCEVGSRVTVLRSAGATSLIGCHDRCVAVDEAQAANSVPAHSEVVDCALLDPGSPVLLLADGSLVCGDSTLSLSSGARRLFSFGSGLAVCFGSGAAVYVAWPSFPLSLPSLGSDTSADMVACFSTESRLTVLVKGRAAKRSLLALQWDWRYGTPASSCLLDRETATAAILGDYCDDTVVFALPATTISDPSLSVLLVFRSSTGSSRLVKVNSAGKVLLEMGLEGAPSAAQTVSCGLALLVGQVVQVLDVRYGCVLVSEELPALSSMTHVCLSQSHVNGEDFLCVLSAKTAKGKGGGSSVFRSYVSLPSKEGGRGSLRRALGVKAESRGTQAAAREKDYLVLEGLPGTIKRKLEEAQERLHDNIIKSAGSEPSEEPQAGVVTGYRKLPRLCIDVPAEAADVVLERFSAAHLDNVLDSDWSMVKTLLRSHSVSVERRPEVITGAIAAGRADVLSYILQFAPDLNERTALFILCSASGISEADLACLSYMGGELHWRRRPTEKRKSRGRRKRDFDAEAASEGTGLDDCAWQPCASNLELMRLLCEAAIRRSAAFSRSLLAEAFTGISSAATTLLVRVFTLLLRGLTSPCTEEVHLGPFTDIQVSRAVDWIEAALDAHFSTMALNVSVADAETVKAVRSALEAVGSIALAIEDVERVFGLWEHIRRTSKLGRRIDASLNEVYSVEKLCF